MLGPGHRPFASSNLCECLLRLKPIELVQTAREAERDAPYPRAHTGESVSALHLARCIDEDLGYTPGAGGCHKHRSDDRQSFHTVPLDTAKHGQPALAACILPRRVISEDSIS